MSDQCKIVFAGLAAKVSPELAKQLLQQKLKLNEKTVKKFLQGQDAFNPTSLEKAQKQQKVFASLGIKVQIVTPDHASQTDDDDDEQSQKERDLKIINALDYITTSLIRLEEKVDELAQNTPAKMPDLEDDIDPEPHAEPLIFEDDLDEPIKKGPNKVFMLIGGFILLLLIALLVISLLYPDMVTF